MIRHYTIFCKVFSIKTSISKGLWVPPAGVLVCPVCGSRGNCVPHGRYRRSLIDLEEGKVVYSVAEIKRVRCVSCGHTHAILPDYIVPYATYSLLFILRVLASHFLGRGTVEEVCRRYSITASMLYEWKALFLAHKDIWLGVLENMETSPSEWIRRLLDLPSYAGEFGRPFYQKTAHSFLQRHRDAASFRHAVF